MENNMKTSFLALPAVILAMAGCVPTTTANQSAATGALAGAAIGAAVSDDDDRFEGALTGAAVGAVAGTLIGESSTTPGDCVYRDAYNRQYVARCP
jgi:uncharacterized membrane protein